jgi:hypothetical protein
MYYASRAVPSVIINLKLGRSETFIVCFQRERTTLCSSAAGSVLYGVNLRFENAAPRSTKDAPVAALESARRSHSIGRNKFRALGALPRINFSFGYINFYGDLHNKGRFILLPSDGFSHIHTTQQFTSLAVAFSLNLARQWNIFARHIISTSERAPESVCRPDFLRAACEYYCTRQRALSVAKKAADFAHRLLVHSNEKVFNAL